MTEREVVVVGIDKASAGAKAAASASRLAGLVGVDAKAFAAKVAAAGRKAFVPAITLRKTDPILTANVAKIDAVTGVLRMPQLQVLGPTRTWAAPILGTVSEASAEQITKSGGTLTAGDSMGQQGLEYRYDAQLRGTRGLAVQAVKKGADGSVIDKRELFAEVSQQGAPLKTTLDSKAQTAAETALASQTKQPTALVVVRVSTGEILVGCGRAWRERLHPGVGRQGGAWLDLQDRELPRPCPQGRDGRHHAAVHPHAHRQRPGLRQLHGLPLGAAGQHPAHQGAGLLVQHGLHQPAPEDQPGRAHLGGAVARHG